MRIRNSSIMDDTEFEEPPNEKLDMEVTFTDSRIASCVLSGMDTLRQAGQLCDCVLRVGKKLAEFTAHQAVLASVSPYFMSMFEQDPRTEARKSYNVKETTPEAFQTLLDYAYTGKLTMTVRTVKDVYRAASLLKFGNVVSLCSDYLLNSLHTSNCLEVRSFVREDTTLVKKTDEFIQSNLSMMREHKAFLSLPQLNIKLLGESRGLSSGPDASTIAKLISDWLLKSTATPTTEPLQEVDSTDTVGHSSCSGASAAAAAPTAASSSLGGVDMQVLTKHSNVLFLDADNHLKDIHGMDESLSRSDEVQDYVKACKMNPRGRRTSNEFTQHDNVSSTVDIIAHDQVHGSMYNIVTCIRGVIYNVVVRLQTVDTSSHNGSTRNSIKGDDSSCGGSSGEEDDKTNGLDSYYQSSVSSFEPLAEMNIPRCGVGLASWDGKLIALGGNDRAECLDSVETYDPDTNLWSNLPCMRYPRGRFECAVMGDSLYACGGSDGRRELDTVECFDGSKWKPATRMPQSKASAGVGVLNNELYVVGGYNGQRAERSCEVFNATTKQWSKIAKLQEGRSQAAVCSHKGLLYAFGGTDSWNCYNTVEVYDRQMNVWRFVASMSQARRGAAAVNYRGKIYVVGGSDGSKSLDTIEIYDPQSNTWCMGPSLTIPRSNAGLAVLAGCLYIAGGYGKNKFLSSMEVLEGDDDSQWCSYLKNNNKQAAAATTAAVLSTNGCSEISTDQQFNASSELVTNVVSSSDSDPDH